MNRGTMGVNSLPVTRQRRGCDLNPGRSAPESSTLTTRLPSHPSATPSSEKLRVSAVADGPARRAASRASCCGQAWTLSVIYSHGRTSTVACTGCAKSGPQTHDHNSVKTEPIKKIFTGRFLGKSVVKRILKIPLHLAYVATLPRETLILSKQAINDKLQGSVATYLRCGGVVNKQIRTGSLLNLSVIFFKSVNIWPSYKQERDCLVHFLRLSAVCWPDAQSAWDNHALASNFAKHLPILFFSLADSAINLS